VNVKAGDYLLAVNGRELRASDDVYAFFEETTGKQTVLRVAADAAGKQAREVTVVPVADEQDLRHLAWVEGKRRLVDRLSGGKLAYVYLPDTATEGYASFNRYFFAQSDRQGVVLDARYNSGGSLSDYIIDVLRRQPMTLTTTREGANAVSPTQAIFGPKAMLINEFSGSGGDALPWYFKRLQMGPLIGKRTWGGLIGIFGYPLLIDGGFVTVPRLALSGLRGEWEVENHGVAPDIDLDDDPQAERQGHDVQIERAVDYLMKEIAAHPQPTYATPPYPDFHPGQPRR
jgi:tricorn protease